MNKTMSEAESYALALRSYLESHPVPAFIKLFVVPPFTALKVVSDLLADLPVLVGAQNMHWERNGSFTGEISPLMVLDTGATLVELGHSERRMAYGETDFTVNKKTLSALRHGLRPLICVGETALEREYGVTRECVSRQVKVALRGVTTMELGKIIFAYEPAWAIGESGVPAEPDYANSVHKMIREAISELYGPEYASEVPILYGGSVHQGNASDLMVQSEIDGLFIGRAAWEASGFIEFIETAVGMFKRNC